MVCFHFIFFSPSSTLKKLPNSFFLKKRTLMSSFCCIKPPQVLLYLNKSSLILVLENPLFLEKNSLKSSILAKTFWILPHRFQGNNSPCYDESLFSGNSFIKDAPVGTLRNCFNLWYFTQEERGIGYSFQLAITAPLYSITGYCITTAQSCIPFIEKGLEC